MNQIWQTVLAIIASVGGAGVIVCAVVKFALDKIASRLESKYQVKLDKELERFKSNLDKKSYISKVRFDAEFSLYRELTVTCREMVNTVYFMYPTYANVPAGEEDHKKYEEENYKKAAAATSEFSKLMMSNAPFVPKDFFDRFMELTKLCKQNLNVYEQRWNRGYLGIWEGSEDKRRAEDEAYSRTSMINEKFEAMIDTIRNYLSELDVTE